MIRFLLLQLIAHIVSDFYFQTDDFCREKESGGFRSWQLYVHAAVVFVVAWGLSFSFGFWETALLIAGTHLLFDGLKEHIAKSRNDWSFKKLRFIIDQIAHIVVIVAACAIWSRSFTTMPAWLPEEKHIAVALGVLLCMKPANIFIKELFSIFNIQLPKNQDASNNDLLNAGKLIGGIERLLTFTFVLLGQYEAIGFLMAAKSLLRFSEGDKAKSEYVLVGTLLSFSLAVAIGVIVKINYHIEL